MPKTSQLGISKSKLGSSMVLGAATSSDNFEVSAISTLVLTQTVETPQTEVFATSTLVLTSTASAPKIFHKSALSTLALTQAALNSWKFTTSISTLALTQALEQHGPISRSASSEIILSVEAIHHPPIERSVVSTLALTQTAVQSGPLPRSATSTLELTSTADTTTKIRSLSSTISLAHAATGALVKRATSVLTLTQSAVNGKVQVQATSVLALVSQARNTNITEVVPASTLLLTQTVTSNIKMQSVTTPIDLTQTLDVRRPFLVSGTSELVTFTTTFDPTTVTFTTIESGLTQAVSMVLLKTNSARHFLQLTQNANGELVKAGGVSKSASNTLVLVQTATKSTPKSASNPLVLSQSASSLLANHQPRSTLTLGQTASANIARAAFALQSVISLQQAVRFVHERSDTECLYSPFVGSTTDLNAPAPPPTTMPAASELTGFRLLFPSTGMASDELILRSPNLGNNDRLGMDRINRETRGGTLVIFADPIWPKVQTLVLSFSVLKREEAQALLTFMRAHIGQEIRLIDWEHRAWKGVIVNPQDPIVEDRQNSFSASFEFEGARE